MVTEHLYDDSDALVKALTSFVSSELANALRVRGQAALVVSGGRTPQRLFETLSQTALAWDQVWVTLADERWLDVSDADSNERLVRTTLLQGAAARARLVPLKSSAPTAEAGALLSANALGAMPRPYDLVLLGMGDDGHTASLFPGAAELAAGLAADAAPCLAVHPPTAPYARISQSAVSLLNSRAIVLLIEGEEKWDAYQRARASGPIEIYPVRAFLLQDEIPVHVYWSR